MSGVESVSLAGDLPVSQNEGSVEHIQAGDSPASTRAAESVAFVMVDDNYFSTLGVPLLTGRVFTPADAPKSPEVVIINHFMAEKYWPEQDPVGKAIQIENGHRVATIVGVVADGKYVDIDEPARPFMYFDLNQRYQSVVYLLARTKAAPRPWLAPLSEALQKVAPTAFFMTLTMDDWLDFSLFVPKVTLFCIVAFGVLAFVLATVGLYGAVFYSVGERKKELGIRAALGASPGHLWNMIFRQTSVVTATGVSLGILGGVVASTLVRSLLYGIHPIEWTVFAAVALAMGLVTALTAYSAARPWLHTDPMESVRHV